MKGSSESNTEPLSGIMSGVKLAFPRIPVDGAVYGVAQVHYSDQKAWSDQSPKVPYSGSEQPKNIRDFILTLNRRTFLPVSTKSDMETFVNSFVAYGDENLPPESKRWLELIVSPLSHSTALEELKALFEQQLTFSRRVIGPIRSGPSEFDLETEIAAEEGGPYVVKEMRDVYDKWYVDKKTWGTLIACMHHSSNNSPLKLSCVHYFVVPELKAVAHVGYSCTDDLSNWRFIEDQVRARISTYVIKGQ